MTKSQKKPSKIKQSKFIEAYLQNGGNITKACEAAGISRDTYYKVWRDKYDFDEEVKTAEQNWISALIERMYRDALNPEKMNTTAAIFLMKAFDPERFDDAIRKVKYCNETGQEDPDKTHIFKIIDANARASVSRLDTKRNSRKAS